MLFLITVLVTLQVSLKVNWCLIDKLRCLDVTYEDIKKKYNVTEELTDELEERIKKEHAYIFRDLMPEN